MINLAIFLSGGGSNFKAIAHAIESGELDARIVLIAGNRADAKGLEIAGQMNIPTAVFNRAEFDKGSQFANYMLSTLKKYSVDLIVLAGYLRKIPPIVVRKYRKRILNIHPALLPQFGGKGMYGMNVHRAVIESGVKESGVSIHYVDEIYDHGEIIGQLRIPVLPDDTPEQLATRILEVEHQFYPKVLKQIVNEYQR
ncbi:MAG: phosphoribosylglycinamide formyltransferase [Candidatus Electryoneaceae bacterium]|nr:phosphoribosylglycinamide formyltransferase [Candidatus Electryoneaceae bacterium]